VRKSNERTGTQFNYLELPTDIVFEIVLCRLRYKLSLRNLAEMFLLRGFEFTHEAVREWEERFAPLLAQQIRGKRKGKVGRRWYVDERYLKVKGKWRYLYRAIDRDGNLVDSMLSAVRDMVQLSASSAALNPWPRPHQQVTTHGHDSYPRAIREVPGLRVCCVGKLSCRAGRARIVGDIRPLLSHRRVLLRLAQRCRHRARRWCMQFQS
jgi:putative transposase